MTQTVADQSWNCCRETCFVSKVPPHKRATDDYDVMKEGQCGLKFSRTNSTQRADSLGQPEKVIPERVKDL